MANDMWRTPPEVIEYIENRFGKIELDLCASGKGHVCDHYITEEDDFLSESTLRAYDGSIHGGDLTWMNPPYSNPLPFVKQAIKWSQHGYAVAGILNNDSSTKWYVELEKHAQILMPIMGGRIAFLNGVGEPIAGNNKPQIMFYLAPFGSKVKSVEHVSIDDIYPNGKPKKVKLRPTHDKTEAQATTTAKRGTSRNCGIVSTRKINVSKGASITASSSRQVVKCVISVGKVCNNANQ